MPRLVRFSSLRRWLHWFISDMSSERLTIWSSDFPIPNNLSVRLESWRRRVLRESPCILLRSSWRWFLWFKKISFLKSKEENSSVWVKKTFWTSWLTREVFFWPLIEFFPLPFLGFLFYPQNQYTFFRSVFPYDTFDTSKKHDEKKSFSRKQAKISCIPPPHPYSSLCNHKQKEHEMKKISFAYIL